MKPSKISLLLIILLFATNIFLILNIAAVERTKNTLPERMISDAVQLLERSGIIIDPSDIPYICPSSPIYEGAISDGELTAFAENFSGSITDKEFLPLPGLRMYFSAGGYLFEFSDKMTFSLYRQDEGLSEEVETALNGGGVTMSDKELEKKAKRAIKALFVLSGDASRQAEVTGCVSFGGDSYVATVRRLTQGLVVDGQVMRVYIKDGVIEAARGDWYFGKYKGQYSMPLMDSVNILFKAKDLGEEFSGIIKEMKLNYNVIWHEIDKYYLIPSWKVTFEDEREYVFNALTGDLIS